MKKIIADVFHSEAEYYQELLGWLRTMLAHYVNEYVDASDSGMLSRSGGVIVYKHELLALTEEILEEEKEDKFRETLITELRSIRERGIRTLRSGKVITLEYLFYVMGLDEFEAFLVILALASELDHNLEMLIATLSEHRNVRMPTISLGLRLFAGTTGKQREFQKNCMNRWNILALLFEGMDRISNASVNEKESLFEYGLKLDYRVLSYIQDYESTDESLAGIVQYGYGEVKNKELLIHTHIADGMDCLYKKGTGSEIFFLRGEYGAGKKMQAAKFCERHNRLLLLVDSHRLPEDTGELHSILRRIMREAILQGNAVICICDLEAEPDEEKIDYRKAENILWGFHSWNGILMFTSCYEWDRKIQEYGRPVRKLMLPETTTEERMILWNAMLEKEDIPEDMDIEFLSDKYILSAGCIKNCIAEYKDRLQMEEKKPRTEWLLEACRNQIDHCLGKDAVRIRAQYTWDELVLPKAQKDMLKDACNQVLLHHHVYHRWGFEERIAYGRGVSMIFYGPPGTGKTMGAQVIANELKLELYKVDMSGVMSKYVGESEKKLGNIFEQAKKSQSILFFDEADVLFGKRTEQKDSNDKYSNASTAYLLQKIEEYEGIIILATNLLQNFDNAFIRRFKFIIEFPFTDAARRKEIWQKVFPDKVPIEDLDVNYLAEEFKFSGSQIKNVAVAAAFLAAGEHTEVSMKHILTGVKREMAKTGKKLIARDFGPYDYLMEEEEDI